MKAAIRRIPIIFIAILPYSLVIAHFNQTDFINSTFAAPSFCKCVADHACEIEAESCFRLVPHFVCLLLLIAVNLLFLVSASTIAIGARAPPA
jgi:hypothetical protein